MLAQCHTRDPNRCPLMREVLKKLSQSLRKRIVHHLTGHFCVEISLTKSTIMIHVNDSYLSFEKYISTKSLEIMDFKVRNSNKKKSDIFV